MRREEVPAALAGERIDRVVSLVTGCSRRAAAELIDEGGVRHNGRPVRKGSERVSAGDDMEIDDEQLGAVPVVEPDPTIVLDVVHEDPELVVVDKPAGLVVHPGAGTASGTLVNALVACYPGIVGIGEPERPGIVHRLDRDTSGLLVVARTERARASLVAQLAARSVERRYLAVVWGHPDADEGLVDGPIGRHPRRPTRMAVVAGGREARTRYRVVRRAESPAPVSVLRCELETGRTHQIRVHCAAIGHPVVGDEVYGGARAALAFGRPALHAELLGFDHPGSGERLRFERPPPEDLAALLARLR